MGVQVNQDYTTAAQYGQHNGYLPPPQPNGNTSYQEPTYQPYQSQYAIPTQIPVSAPSMSAMAAVPEACPSRKRKEATQVVDLTGDSPPPPSRRRREAKDEGGWEPGKTKRKAKMQYANDGSETGLRKKRAPPAAKPGKSTRGKAIELEDDESPVKKAKNPKDEEKRLRRHRAKAPTAYLEVRDRALTQRMFALDRQRDNSNPDHPTETVSLAGTTGNVYTIVIDKVPSCNCPHAKKGNQCKHIAYVLSRVLRAPTHLEYQLAFISSELREIFALAPPPPSETAEGDTKDGNRKPIEDECPICCVDFEPESAEEIVYCKAACGNNIHKTCFNQWAATKTGSNVTCPFCRTPWQSDGPDVKNVAKSGSKNAEGYSNVAGQLGLSGKRDYSTYNSYWVRNQARFGHIAWDDDGVMDHEY